MVHRRSKWNIRTSDICISIAIRCLKHIPFNGRRDSNIRYCARRMDNLHNIITMNASLIIAIITSSALSTLISCIYNFLSSNSRQKKVNKLLLLGEMERRLDVYRRIGKVSSEQLQIFTEIASLCHDEGGNGYAEAMLSEVRALPHT